MIKKTLTLLLIMSAYGCSATKHADIQISENMRIKGTNICYFDTLTSDDDKIGKEVTQVECNESDIFNIVEHEKEVVYNGSVLYTKVKESMNHLEVETSVDPFGKSYISQIDNTESSYFSYELRISGDLYDPKTKSCFKYKNENIEDNVDNEKIKIDCPQH